VVIIEDRLGDWYLHVPALDLGLPVNSPADAPLSAARLVSAATGAAIDPNQVEVLRPANSEVLLPATPAEVTIRHDDGALYSGRHVGWLRQRDRSWRALVCYLVAGVQWERALPASKLDTAALSGVQQGRAGGLQSSAVQR
jgi:hypothetical protein